MLQEAAFSPASSSCGASWGLAGSPRPVSRLIGPEQGEAGIQLEMRRPFLGFLACGHIPPVAAPSSRGHLPVRVCLKPPSPFC